MNLKNAFAKIDETELAALPDADISNSVDVVTVIAPVPTNAIPVEQAVLNLGRKKPDHLWKYFNGNGELLFAMARWNDAAGKKVSFLPISWVREADGFEHFAFKHQIAPRPLYGLLDLQMRPDAPIVVVEGEKCADAAKAVFPDYVVVTSSGGSGSAADTDWTPLTGRSRVLIWPDLDPPGADYATEVADILATLKIPEVRIVDAQRLAVGELAYSERKKKIGWDVADAVDEDHDFKNIRDAAIAAAQPHGSIVQRDRPEIKAIKDSTIEMPVGYSLSVAGLTWSDPNDEEKPPILIASKFSVIAETRDQDGASWGVLLHWNDHDGRPHQLALPRSSLAGDGAEARRMLLDGGLYVAPGKKARDLLNSFLLQVRSPARARATQRVGWHGNSFVLPDQSFGDQENERLLLQTTTAHEHAFRQKGTLDAWKQNVARMR